jgi:hypothetical protein
MKLPTSRKETTMSKYGEMTGLLDWVMNQSKKKEPKKMKREMTLKDYIKFQKDLEDFALWSKEKEDREKKIKKAMETKQQSFNPLHFAMLLIASFPITAPLYVWWLKTLIESMK